MKEHYKCTMQPRIGPADEDAKEGVVLNRVIRWTQQGVEVEADPRQAEKLLECFSFDDGCKGSSNTRAEADSGSPQE